MKHSFIDKYSELDSPVHRLDPRVKILAAAGFILTLVSAPAHAWVVPAVALGCIAVAVLASKVPLLYVLGRSLVVVPFAAMAALALIIAPSAGGPASGLLKGLNIAVKAWLSAMTLVLLTATTPYPRLLRGLEKLGMPRVMVLILSFMYRYLFVLVDEAMRMEQAWKSRAFGLKGLRAAKSLAGVIGVLLIRSYERSERVYGAMLARGFDGTVRTLNPLRFSRRDWAFGLLSAIVLGGMWLISTLGYRR